MLSTDCKKNLDCSSEYFFDISVVYGYLQVLKGAKRHNGGMSITGVVFGTHNIKNYLHVSRYVMWTNESLCPSKTK